MSHPLPPLSPLALASRHRRDAPLYLLNDPSILNDMPLPRPLPRQRFPPTVTPSIGPPPTVPLPMPPLPATVSAATRAGTCGRGWGMAAHSPLPPDLFHSMDPLEIIAEPERVWNPLRKATDEGSPVSPTGRAIPCFPCKDSVSHHITM